MSNMKTLAVAMLCLASAAGAGVAHAQSTDGYHAIQVFPVVVDSAAFTQRFTFRNSDAAAMTLSVFARPGSGTTQATTLACPDVTIPANGVFVAPSLRTLCPGLAAGSQYGFLYASDKNATRKHSFAGYSRVSNAAGIGFSVEAFPAHTFTSATVRVEYSVYYSNKCCLVQLVCVRSVKP